MDQTGKEYLYEKENLIDPSLERTDPTPSIFNLFRQFNMRFFWDKLNMVEVSWSGQMTSSAGVCSFQPNSGFCRIRLSAPLLSLRPRQDLVETLLHEMIHAYLFITNNNRDRTGHGPEFHKHMHRINNEAGTNITVFHTFHDEVNHYQQHVWRCNGPCQRESPFFGFLRRATGRAPGPNDRWWEHHQFRCPGVFEKIQEPPGYRAKEKAAKTKLPKKGSSSDIRNMFTPIQKPSTSSNIHTFGDITTKDNQKGPGGLLKSKGSATFVPPGNAKNATKQPSKSSSSNIHTFVDLTQKVPSVVKNKAPATFIPTGTFKNSTNLFVPQISISIQQPTSSNYPSSSQVNSHVRNIWASKFPETSPSSSPKRKSNNISDGVIKKKACKCKHCNEMIDELNLNSHLKTCKIKKFPCPVCGQNIVNGSLEAHLSVCLSDSITEDIFSTDEVEIIEEKLNDNLKVACPVCGALCAEVDINRHIDECLNLKAINEGAIGL